MPKRRSKKTGRRKTKKGKSVIQHDYTDYCNSINTTEVGTQENIQSQVSGGETNKNPSHSRASFFPLKLHAALDALGKEGLTFVASWQPHGRCFVVHDQKSFADVIIPEYFRQTKWASFQRQLNLYGFKRLTAGLDKGAYYHELFLRNRIELCRGMKRIKVKGTKTRPTYNPSEEPDFYSMPPLPMASNASSIVKPESMMKQTPVLQVSDCGTSKKECIGGETVIKFSGRQSDNVFGCGSKAEEVRRVIAQAQVSDLSADLSKQMSESGITNEERSEDGFSSKVSSTQSDTSYECASIAEEFHGTTSEVKISEAFSKAVTQERNSEAIKEDGNEDVIAPRFGLRHYNRIHELTNMAEDFIDVSKTQAHLSETSAEAWSEYIFDTDESHEDNSEDFLAQLMNDPEFDLFNVAFDNDIALGHIIDNLLK